MKYIVDNDLHIHSQISACSCDPGQTTERLLEYALENGIKTLCLADHFWDDSIGGASDWYNPQNYERISKAKPLPQADGVRFLFGCETELNRDLVLGISKENYDKFDFIVIPTTHFHMLGYTLTEEEGANAQTRADTWVKHFEAVLDMDLPFHKVGIAHLICPLMAKECYKEMLALLPVEEMTRLFTKAAGLGVGIELNYGDILAMHKYEDAARVFRIAKECGCKFYFASDAHHPDKLASCKEVFEKAVDLLELTEEDKFRI